LPQFASGKTGFRTILPPGSGGKIAALHQTLELLFCLEEVTVTGLPA